MSLIAITVLYYNIARKKYGLPCPQQGKSQVGFYESARLNHEANADVRTKYDKGYAATRWKLR